MLQLSSCACMMGYTKFPIISRLCGAQALIRKILMSGAETEDCCNIRVCELVKYQVQLERNISHVPGIR